jgi:hypothetical protein
MNPVYPIYYDCVNNLQSCRRKTRLDLQKLNEQFLKFSITFEP